MHFLLKYKPVLILLNRELQLKKQKRAFIFPYFTLMPLLDHIHGTLACSKLKISLFSIYETQKKCSCV